jgi:hypothetical protein
MFSVFYFFLFLKYYNPQNPQNRMKLKFLKNGSNDFDKNVVIYSPIKDKQSDTTCNSQNKSGHHPHSPHYILA